MGRMIKSQPDFSPLSLSETRLGFIRGEKRETNFIEAHFLFLTGLFSWKARYTRPGLHSLSVSILGGHSGRHGQHVIPCGREK